MSAQKFSALVTAQGESSPAQHSLISGSYAELAVLIESEYFGVGGDYDATILARSAEMKRAKFGDEVFSVVPLYVTSICQERCVYCNYRAENKDKEITRRRLTDVELEQEVEFLVTNKGLHTIELVYATDPQMRDDTMARHISIVRRVLDRLGGGTIGLNAEPFDSDVYSRFLDAGLDFAVLWQETYNFERYKAEHPGTTKKTNMAYRIDTYERMIQGGMKRFGMGILSGLAPWRSDWAMLARHEAYLLQKYGIGPSILGIPRLKPAAGALMKTSETIPTDYEMGLLIAAHNIAAPDCLPFINTRETWENCVRYSQGGGCLFTFNCITIPGGYSFGSKGYQFPTGNYDSCEYIPSLERAGFKVSQEFPGRPVSGKSS